MESEFKGDKRFALALYVLDWLTLALSLLTLIANYPVSSHPWLLAVSALSLIGVIYYLLIFKAYLRRSRLALTFMVLINAFVVFAMMLTTGGVPNVAFPIFYVLLLFYGVYISYWSIIIAAAGLLILFAPWIQSPGAYVYILKLRLPEALSFLVLIPFSIFFGRELSTIRADRKRASFLAEHVIQEKSRDEALLSSIADAVYAVDREKRIIIWNAAAETLTGLSGADVLGLRDFDLLDLRDAKGNKVCPGLRCPIDEAWATNKPVRRDDMSLLLGDKTSIALSYNAAPIRDTHNVVTGAVVIFYDITRRKEVERMRNEFISVASHEMRTPMAAVEGYISLAQTLGEKTLTPKVDEYLKKAHMSVIAAANLLKNLLLVSKIDEDALPIKPSIFALNDVLESTVTILTPVAMARGLVLKIDQAGGGKAISEPLKVEADQERIKEVIANLIDNAIKFTKQGSVTASLKGDKNFITLCIADTGPGIAKDEIPKLFQKFYRVDNTFTREVGGTGLGLYLARSVIERSGGKIWAESTEGQGAKFCFTLPRVS